MVLEIREHIELRGNDPLEAAIAAGPSTKRIWSRTWL